MASELTYGLIHQNFLQNNIGLPEDCKCNRERQDAGLVLSPPQRLKGVYVQRESAEKVSAGVKIVPFLRLHSFRAADFQ